MAERLVHIEEVRGSNPLESTTSDVVHQVMISRVVKNSTYLLLAQGLVKLISFAYTIFLLSNLGVGDFGLYVVALAYFSILTSIADFGFNRFLIREGASNTANLDLYLGAVMVTRILVAGLLFAVFSLWLMFFDRDTSRVNLSILAILAVLPQSISSTLDSVLVAKLKFSLSSIGLVLVSLVSTAIGVVLVKIGLTSLGAVLGLSLGQLILTIFLMVMVLKNKVRIKFNFGKVEIKQLLRGSLPYGLLGIMGLIYFKIDTLMLSYLKGSEQTGLYGAAYKFLEAIIFVPSAFSAASFPFLAKLHEINLGQVKKFYYQSFLGLGLLSLLILIAYQTLLPLLIREFIPQFIPSIGALYILSLTIPFMFIHAPAAQILLSSNKYIRPVLLASILTLSFNVISNLVLIPIYGFIGAAWITVLSEVLSFVVFFIILYLKILKK